MLKIKACLGLLCCLGMIVFGMNFSNHVQAASNQVPDDEALASGGKGLTDGKSKEFFQEEKLFDVNDGKGYEEYRIPSVSVTANGTVLALAEARTGGDQTPTDLVLKRSMDGGETFSDQVTLAPGVAEGNAEMNPMLLTENNGDTVYLLWSRWEWGDSKYFMKKSTDNGATWEETEDITYVLDEYKDPDSPEYFADISGAGMGPGHGFQMSNGALVVPIYFTTDGWEDSTVAYIYSKDGGSNWEAGPKVPNPDGFSKIHENMMVELSNGGLMANMRNPDSNNRAVTTTDGLDQSWSTPVSDTELIDPVNAGSLARYDEENILFTNTANRSARTNMTIRMSNDDGQTWNSSREIYAGMTGYSDVNVGPDQTIYTLYEKPAGSKIVLARFNKEWVVGNEAYISATHLQAMVEAFEQEGELEKETARSLGTHLTAVIHYEDKQLAEKVVKHLNGLEQLLEKQAEVEQISPQVYQALKAKTEELLEQYE